MLVAVWNYSFENLRKSKNLPCAESYVEKKISIKFPKNLAYRKCKNLAHYLAKLNGLKWAKLGAEAWHEWLTPAMLCAFTGEHIFGEAGTMCGKLC